LIDYGVSCESDCAGRAHGGRPRYPHSEEELTLTSLKASHKPPFNMPDVERDRQ